MSGEANRDASSIGPTHRDDENPFSTRFVRPGALVYRFGEGMSAARLADRFIALGRRAQIIGRHGAGKSTLLAMLMGEFAGRGESVKHLELHDGERSLPTPLDIAPRSLVCVDGYEQLSWWNRAALGSQVRRNGCGLLVTAHRASWFPAYLPVLCELRSDASTAVLLVRGLLAEHGGASSAGDISSAEIERMYFEADGDIRELFFRLYDLYESRRR